MKNAACVHLAATEELLSLLREWRKMKESKAKEIEKLLKGDASIDEIADHVGAYVWFVKLVKAQMEKRGEL